MARGISQMDSSRVASSWTCRGYGSC